MKFFGRHRKIGTLSVRTGAACGADGFFAAAGAFRCPVGHDLGAWAKKGKGDAFSAFGRGTVLVYDARSAKVELHTPGQHHGATNLRMHVLRAGMSLNMGQRKTRKR